MALRIPKEHAAALTSLVRMGQGEFVALKELLDQEKPTAEPSKVAERIEKRFKLSEVPNSGELVQAVVQLVRTKRRFRDNENRLLNSLLGAMDELTDEEKAVARERITLLIASDGPLYRSIKAHEVLSSHQRTYSDARVLTDIRPVFTDDLEATVRHAVTVHTLKLTYIEDGEEKTFYVALDTADLLEIRTVLDRAEQKDRSVAASLKGLDVELYIPEHSR